MGVGVAVALGVGALATTGASMYAASEQADAASSSQAAFADAFKKVPKIDPVEFSRLELDNPWLVFNQYFRDAAQALPQAQGWANQLNSAYRAQLNKAVPGLTNMVGQGSRFVNSLLQGQLSAETRGAVERSSAYKALQGGMGPGSEGYRALTARDLGRTVEDQQAKGMAYLPGMVSMGQSLAPVAAHNLLLTPQEMLQRVDQQNITNFQVANQELAFNKSIEIENANARYQGALTQAGINSQVDFAKASANAAMASAIASGVSSLAGIGAGYANGNFGTGMGTKPPAKKAGAQVNAPGQATTGAAQ